LRNFGAIWPILSLDQAISSLIRQQNNPIIIYADYVNAEDANGLKKYTYAVL
jgi:hypothetical protein